ncbi:hypothetical protein ATANTOWER_017083 [Ataeniobius toweri]|uniref:Uncharacterized protein n=1 Tax=Ataeniobius toweri TaxID=208326 RepID=A0ABU7AKK4_9TELE|nr:hypothetical protein [Ataeniobius toweri]
MGALVDGAGERGRSRISADEKMDGGYPLLPSLLCGSGGASRTLSRAASRRPAEDHEIGMINNYNYWQTCQLLCGNGHL